MGASFHIKNLALNILIEALFCKLKDTADTVHKELSEKYCIEARNAPDLLGRAPFCKRKLFYDKRYPKQKPELHEAMKHLNDSLVTEYYAKKKKYPRRIVTRKTRPFHNEKHKQMVCLPDRALQMEKPIPWVPIYIENVDETTFYTLQYEGYKDYMGDIIQFSLACRNVPYGLYLIFCPTLGEYLEYKVARDEFKIKELEELADEMDNHIKRNKYPIQTTGEHCLKCIYARLCVLKNQPRAGELDEALEIPVNQWRVAQEALKQVRHTVVTLEKEIKELMEDRREAHTEEFDISITNSSKWKLDGERLNKEHPEIARMFKIPFTEEKLIITR